MMNWGDEIERDGEIEASHCETNERGSTAEKRGANPQRQRQALAAPGQR